MTLLHITMNRDRALIATDTATYLTDQGEHLGADVLYWPDGQHVAAMKLYALAHLGAVLCGRGRSSVHHFARDLLTHARDFDHAVELLGRALPSLVGRPKLSGTYNGKPMAHSVFLVGWSPGTGAMVRAAFESSNDYATSIVSAPASGWISHLAPGLARPAWLFDKATAEEKITAYLKAEHDRDPRCLKTAEAYARAAIGQAREEDPAAPYGGRLLVAELTRAGLQLVDAGDVGLPPRRSGAPDLITQLHPGLSSCIAISAATEAFADETGADSVSIPGAGGTSFKTCASRTWTNTWTGGPVIVQWDAEVRGLHFSSGATLAAPDDFASASWVLKINGSIVQSDPFIDSTGDALPPDASTKLSRQVGWQREIAPGETVQVYISVGGGTDSNAATISWALTRLRFTVIKR